MNQLTIFDVAPEPPGDPGPPPPPPSTPFAEGQQVVVSDPAGDWVGKVYQDVGAFVWVIQRDRPTALAYDRAQVTPLSDPAAGQQAESQKLRAFEAELRSLQAQHRPKVDCRQCRHYRPYCVWPQVKLGTGLLYECAARVFPGPCSPLAHYGLHIGCRSFEEVGNAEIA